MEALDTMSSRQLPFLYFFQLQFNSPNHQNKKNIKYGQYKLNYFPLAALIIMKAQINLKGRPRLTIAAH